MCFRLPQGTHVEEEEQQEEEKEEEEEEEETKVREEWMWRLEV